jgi:hypothetical protein
MVLYRNRLCGPDAGSQLRKLLYLDALSWLDSQIFIIKYSTCQVFGDEKSLIEITCTSPGEISSRMTDGGDGAGEEDRTPDLMLGKRKKHRGRRKKPL